MLKIHPLTTVTLEHSTWNNYLKATVDGTVTFGHSRLDGYVKVTVSKTQ